MVIYDDSLYINERSIKFMMQLDTLCIDFVGGGVYYKLNVREVKNYGLFFWYIHGVWNSAMRIIGVSTMRR